MTKRLKRYEGFAADAPPGERIRYVRATAPAAARKILAETGHTLVTQRKTPKGPGWGAAWGARH